MSHSEPRQVDNSIDQQLTFVDVVVPSSTLRTRRLGKSLKLAAACACIALTFLLSLLMLPAAKPDRPRDGFNEASNSGRENATALAADNGIVKESPAASAVAARAQASGLSVVDVLCDEAMLQYRAGRLREALELFSAALIRDPHSELVRDRAQATESQLTRRVDILTAGAERALAQFRFVDAARAWEQVLFLTDPRDPRHVRAQIGLNLARPRRD